MRPRVAKFGLAIHFHGAPAPAHACYDPLVSVRPRRRLSAVALAALAVAACAGPGVVPTTPLPAAALHAPALSAEDDPTVHGARLLPADLTQAHSWGEAPGGGTRAIVAGVRFVDWPDGAMVAGAVHPFRPRTRVLPAPTEHEPRLRLLALTGALEDRDPPTVVGPTDASGAADALIAYLVRHGYLDGPRDRDRPAAGTDSGGDRS